MRDRALQSYIDNLPEAEREGFLQSIEMGDNEFGMEIAPRLSKKGREGFDPNIANYVDMEHEYNLHGTYNPNNTIVEEDFPGHGIVAIEPGELYAFGAQNAKPDLWAHEYRHATDTDGGGERYNRIADLMTAQNSTEFRDTARMVLDERLGTLQRQFRRTDNQEVRQKLQQKYGELAKIYNKIGNPDADYDTYKQAMAMVMDNPNLDVEDKFERHNKINGSTTEISAFINELMASDTTQELPKEYRRGGRVRLI